MRAARLLLLLLGASAATYGGWLLYPQIDTTVLWLVGGPLLHDALVAPLAALVGLTLGRLVTDRVRRAWITAGLVTTATLLLIAVPLTWRPAHAPPNPGLQDRDYPLELTAALAVLWTAIMIILVSIRVLTPGAADRPADRLDLLRIRCQSVRRCWTGRVGGTRPRPSGRPRRRARSG